VEVHQGAHNTLLDLNEPVPETKKVADFLAGITDPRLSNAKDLILGDAQRLQDFESCQQYLKTLISNKTTQEKHERQISGIKHGRQTSSYKGRRLNTPDKDTSEKLEDVTAWTYTKEEWSKLTGEERAKVKQLRKDRKSNRSRTRGPNIRNALATTQVGGNDASYNESYQDGSVNPASESSDSDDNQANAGSPTRCSGRSVIGRQN
jgi:hypothetical protein